MIPFVSLGLLTIGWSYAVYAIGGVDASSSRWFVQAVALAGILLWLLPRNHEPGKAKWLDSALLFAVLLLALLQVVPLPIGWIHLISPERFLQLSALSQVIGPIRNATLSSVNAASRDAILVLAAYALVYLVVFDLCRRWPGRRWLVVAPVMGIAFLEAVLGLLQYYAGADVASGTYLNRNHFAGLLEMSLPFSLMLGFQSLAGNRSRLETPAWPTIRACLFFGMSAVMLVSVINSQSRMGFISVLVSLLVMGLVGVSSHYSGGGSAWRRWLPVIVVPAIIGAAFVFLPSDQLIGRFASLASTQEPSEDTRRELWKETLPLVKAYPLAGCGLGGYESCFLPYKTVAPGYTADFAHNDYLQVTAEFGLPAFVLLIALALMAYGTALRRTAIDNPGRFLAIACVGSLSAILLHSFVDFNLYMPANAMLATWVGALARNS